MVATYTRMKVARSTFPNSVLQLCFFCAFIVVANAGENVIPEKRSRVGRQLQRDQVIDDIFQIPITAIQQTANVAQGISPDNSDKINNIFQVPIATLEAVSNLVKGTGSRRAQNAGELQRIRQEKREKILAEREQQRVRREKQRLQQQLDKNSRYHHRDPFGLNSLMNLLIGHRRKPVFNKPQAGTNLNNQHPYQVYEDVNEGHGNAEAGSFVGFFFPPSKSTQPLIQNKVAPQDDQQQEVEEEEERIRNKLVTQREHRYKEEDLPVENKIAPRNNRILFE